MTNGQLKERLSKPSLFQGLMILAKDPTLGDTRKDQMLGLLFNVISGGNVWDECNNNEEL